MLEVVDKARSLIDTDKQITMSDIVGQLGVERLDAADRLLVSAIINSIEINLSASVPDDRTARLSQFLDWIEQAALMS